MPLDQTTCLTASEFPAAWLDAAACTELVAEGIIMFKEELPWLEYSAAASEGSDEALLAKSHVLCTKNSPISVH